MGIKLKEVTAEERKKLIAVRKANEARRKQAVEAARQKVIAKGKVLAEQAKAEAIKKKIEKANAKRQAHIDRMKRDEETRPAREALKAKKLLAMKQEREKQAIANFRKKYKVPDSAGVTINPETGGFRIKERMEVKEEPTAKE